MKKILLILLCLSVLIFAIRGIYADKQPSYITNIDYLIEDTIQEKEACLHFGDAKTFVNYDVLRLWINDEWNLQYDIVANWRWYHIDDRGNLCSDCSFSSVPIVIEISEYENWYFVNSYESETDQTKYKNFVKENFSWSGYMVWQSRERNNIHTKKIETLSIAENYFWMNLYENKIFDCSFCDIKWYYYDTINNKSWDVMDIYGLEQLHDKYIIFNLDWTVQIFDKNNSWEFMRYFGKDDSTIILKSDKTGQTIERLIVDNLKSEEIRDTKEITFIKERIQVYQ